MSSYPLVWLSATKMVAITSAGLLSLSRSIRMVAMIVMVMCAAMFNINAAEIEPGIAETTIESAVDGLRAKSFKQKTEAVKQLASFDDERVLTVLDAMLAGKLYYRKADKQVVIINAKDELYAITHPLSGEEIAVVKKSTLKKISVNNRLRSVLRQSMAQIRLTSKNEATRLQAARDMALKAKDEYLSQFETAIDKEQNAEVLDWLRLAKSMILIKSDDAEVRLAALSNFQGHLESEVTAVLLELTEKNDDGEYKEQDKNVREKAAKMLAANQSDIQLLKVVENVFFGISLGSVLLLAAVGLAITFGVMGVINMAHGEMIMLGAYTTYVIQQLMPDNIGLSLFVSIPMAFLVAGIVGVAIERGIIRHLYGRPLETLLATFGVSLILQQAVRSIFSPLNRQVESPDWMSGSLEINGALSLTYNRIYIIIFSLLVLAALAFLLRKTFIGLQMRAVTQNRAMACSMGIRSGWVDAMTFGLGSGVAGIAGVALSQLTNVGPNLGQAYIVDSFMVVVFGGVGNIMGTFFAAMSLGIANKFLEPWAGAVMAKIFVLVFIILFIQKRPRGMFALKGRSVES